MLWSKWLAAIAVPCRCIAGLLLAPGIAAVPVSAFSSDLVDGIVERYGPKIEFEVLRNGTSVGRHLVRFDEQEDGLTVTSDMSLTVRMLTIPVYEFRYTAVERWHEGILSSLQVDVDDDGDQHRVEAKRNLETVVIQGPTGRSNVLGNVFPTSHWNPAVLREERVLNTITGRVNNVGITKSAYENVAVAGGTLRAAPYRYDGDLSVTAWYDPDGRWVKLAFQAKDGSEIEYRCLSCKADD